MDIFLGPEWLFLPEERIYSKKEKEEIIDDIAEKTRDRDTLIIPGTIMWEDEEFFYNTSPLISKGRLIGETYKLGNGGSKDAAITDRGCKKKWHMDKFLGNSPYQEVNFRKEHKGLFEWKGYRLGMEICCDKGYILDIREPHVDLYFLVSCGRGLEDGIGYLPIELGGYGLCSDGFKKSSKQRVKRMKEGESENIPYKVKDSKQVFEKMNDSRYVCLVEKVEVYELFMQK